MSARLPKPRRSMVDALLDVWLAIASRAGRSALTAAGTMVGIAVLVSTVGLASSAGARIAARFDEMEATELLVHPATEAAGAPGGAGGGVGAPNEPTATAAVLPFDAPARVATIDGVTAASTFARVKGTTPVRGTPVLDPLDPANVAAPIIATSAGLDTVVHATVKGRYFDDFHDRRGEPVAVLGANAAAALHISDVDRSPAIFIDDVPVLVVGIIEEAATKREILDAVLVPDGFARNRFALAQPDQLIVRTRLGAADVVGKQVPFALRPQAPEDLTVNVPPAPSLTRDRVAQDTNGLLLVLSIVSLLIGGLGIANVTLVSVLERTSEIGLRRALGARRRHIIEQFLLESALLGFLGAVAGAAVGVTATVAVAARNDWPPTISPGILLVAPAVGALVGLLAGVYPATRAGAIEPIAALRSAH